MKVTWLVLVALGALILVAVKGQLDFNDYEAKQAKQ